MKLLQRIDPLRKQAGNDNDNRNNAETENEQERKIKKVDSTNRLSAAGFDFNCRLRMDNLEPAASYLAAYIIRHLAAHYFLL